MPNPNLVYCRMTEQQHKVGSVKEWHNPRNEDCRHNTDVTQDCNCKRPIVRKPYRTVRVTDNGVGHNVNPYLVVEIYYNGTITIREKGRRRKYSGTISDIYSLFVRWTAQAEIARKKKLKAQRRAERRAVRARK